jgi:hypothetical protein
MSISQRYIVVALSAGMAAGCASPMVTTERLHSDQVSTMADRAPAHGVEGVPYYLPRTILPIKITGSFKQVVKPGKDDDPEDGKFYEYVLEIEPQDTAQLADPTGLFLLHYNLEAGTDDEITVGVNAKQLLSTVDAKSTDESAAIIKKAAETAAKLAEVAVESVAPPGQPKAVPLETDTIKRRQACKKVLNEFTLVWEVDLSTPLGSGPDGQKIALDPGGTINAAIADRMVRQDSAAPDYAVGQLVALNEQADAAGPADDASNSGLDNVGIRFRVPRPVLSSSAITSTGVRVVDAASGNTCSLLGRTSQVTKNVLVADPRRTVVLNMSRSPLVTKSIKLTVADGILQNVAVTKPSSAKEAASLPLDLIDILLSPIRNLIHGTPTTDAKTKAGGSGGN